MQFQYTFRHVDASEALKEYTQEQFEKVGRFLLKESRWQIFYSMNRHECQVEVVVNGPWGHFKSTSTSDDFYVAVDIAAEKLGKQFQKTKEKHQHHKKPGRSREGRMDRLSPSLDYDNAPYFSKKTG
ncbi:MAG: ribosome hibernation-promoting factor, HPF/YfiA family [Bdellovibrio sp.]